MSEEIGQNVEAPAVQQTATEKMLSQSEVNELVGRVKREAVESYKRQNEQVNTQRQAEQQAPSGLSEEKIRQLASDEVQRLRDQWTNEAQTRSESETAQRIVKNFYDKMATGKEQYEDFDKVTGDIELSRFPMMVQMLAEHIDNVPAVLYELSKSRAKMAQFEISAREFPQEALYDLKRLSESIKNTTQAQNRRIPNAPLSQQRSSSLSADSGGALSIRDLKAKYRG